MEEINVIRDTLIEERERNIRSRHAYENECADLPRGSVSIRVRGKRRYCYLKYRKGNKVITEYRGSADKIEDELRQQVEHRRILEQTIKRLKHEYIFIEKALKQA